ncbi:hypothetical protein CCACVL1_22971 [Corchorus capsularis]|uniref:Uncharacterized protein n=1 Tax=Corchorus capsularis TaxID=210143 RepID=A0A1R3GVT6_COCAP|nr:hypothetical protein CCACVL1_22971 [Corchorus capsularis]
MVSQNHHYQEQQQKNRGISESIPPSPSTAHSKSLSFSRSRIVDQIEET